MSSWIGVYGNNQEEDARFKEIHPVFKSKKDEFAHGIRERQMPAGQEDIMHQYWWTLPCHWDDEYHFKQTESDIRSVLTELQSPEGLEVHLSPHSD